MPEIWTNFKAITIGELKLNDENEPFLTINRPAAELGLTKKSQYNLQSRVN